MDMKSLGDQLLAAGAPVLKSVVENAIGGIGGKLAGAAIDALAEALGTERTPEAVSKHIEADPVGSAGPVRQVEAAVKSDLSRIAEANRDVMIGYQQVLLADVKTEGILSRLWRPIFALVFTLSFGLVVFTACWLMWTRQLGTLTQLGELTTFLSFMFVAGCAVLGVQVWQKSEEKKGGV